AGDEALRQVGQRADAVLRSGDALVRYGGEEFLALLPGADHAAAQAAAERLRQVLAEPMGLRRDDSGRTRVTVSVGIATHDPAAAVYASA
ncbi:MAG: diguanylate cyclase, partial [Gemmatimonadetes bacterium]|nr:diguanylate cyclase [Gemmatimonadota bacterium]